MHDNYGLGRCVWFAVKVGLLAIAIAIGSIGLTLILAAAVGGL